MDDETSIARHEEVAYAPEALPWRFIVRVLIATVAFSTALCFVAYVLWRERVIALGAPLEGRRLGVPHEVSAVRQELFRAATPPPPLWEEQRRALDEYRWVDRSAGIVTIPVEQAIDLVAHQTARRP
jgi:hypothetical protein